MISINIPHSPNPWGQRCRLCWEQLEWRAWPDTKSFDLVQEMAYAWAQLPPDEQHLRWGQPLVPTIEAAWAIAREKVQRTREEQSQSI